MTLLYYKISNIFVKSKKINRSIKLIDIFVSLIVKQKITLKSYSFGIIIAFFLSINSIKFVIVVVAVIIDSLMQNLPTL